VAVAGAFDGADIDLGAAHDAVGADAHAAGGDVVAVVLAARAAEGAARHVGVAGDGRVVSIRRGAVVHVVAGVLAEVAADGAAVAGALAGLAAAVAVRAPEEAVGPAAAVTRFAALATSIIPTRAPQHDERQKQRQNDERGTNAAVTARSGRGRKRR